MKKFFWPVSVAIAIVVVTALVFLELRDEPPTNRRDESRKTPVKTEETTEHPVHENESTEPSQETTEKGLRSMDSGDISTWTATLANSQDESKREDAVLGLASALSKDPADMAALGALKTTALSDTSERVRLQALQQLMFHRDSDSFLFILDRIRLDPSPFLQRNMIRTLEKISTEGYAAFLKMQIRDADAADREFAARRRNAITTLTEIVQLSQDERVRKAASNAISLLEK